MALWRLPDCTGAARRWSKEIRRLAAQVAAPQRRYAFFSRRTNGFEPDHKTIERLRQRYRALVPLHVRLELHRIFLAPFVGPYKPPPV